MRLSLLYIAVLAGSAGAADWKADRFPDWPQETVHRVLTDSPWTRPKTVKLEWRSREDRPFDYREIPGAENNRRSTGGSPVGGIGVKRQTGLLDRADILIRWVGALPVRQATALYKQRNEKLAPEKLNELIAPPETDYVLELFGVPAELAHRGAGMIEALVKDSAYLRLRSGRTLKPSRVAATVHALTMTVRIHFPRTAPIDVKDQEVECFADLQVFSIKEKFKLAPMVYLGHIEL